jgi:endoglucanase
VTGSTYIELASRLMRCPTAPFHERAVIAELDAVLGSIPGLVFAADSFGNRHARLRVGGPRPLAGLPVPTLVAHLDHPGFLVPPGQEGRLVEAFFEGRVEERFFEGARVRMFGADGTRGSAAAVVEAGPQDRLLDRRRVRLETPAPGFDAAFATWDLPLFEEEAGVIRGLACDDLAGCAAVVEALRRLAAAGEPCEVAALFTRAEESGFCGALRMLEDDDPPGILPGDTIFVSVEVSGATEAARVGEGAIVRVGDRSTTFDASLVDRLASLSLRRGIRARRALMDRGTCEATAFARAGHRAGGICIPVHHYHNQHAGEALIVPESVALGDAEALVDLVVALATPAAGPVVAVADELNDFALFDRKGREGLHPIPVGESPSTTTLAQSTQPGVPS